MKQTFTLRPSPHPSRDRAIQAIVDSPDGYCVTVSEPNRTLEQNATLWKLLEAFSNQLEWPVNGYMTELSPEEWKDILSAAFRQQQPRLAQGVHGGVVMLGERTSRMGKREFSDFIDFIQSVAVERDVILWPEEQ